jgi:hypothetical protein
VLPQGEIDALDKGSHDAIGQTQGTQCFAPLVVRAADRQGIVRFTNEKSSQEIEKVVLLIVLLLRT